MVSWRTILNIAGILRSGVQGGFTYSVIGDGQKPVTHVSWFDAARFTNWLSNGQPTGAQGSETTEAGAYTLNGATSGFINKDADASWWIPSENEWYKAAYYDPSLNSGLGGYWLYATKSNTQPNSRNGSSTDANSANYMYDDGIANGFNGGYAVTNSTSSSGSQNYLTPVGAFSKSASAYGTYDQAGNVFNWNDAIIDNAFRGLRGGSWSNFSDPLRSSARNLIIPGGEVNNVGFRVATVPEPTSLLLIGVGGLSLALLGRKRSKSLVQG